MSKPIIRYVETDRGCGLRSGSIKAIRNSIGIDNVHSIRNATEDDVAWVKHMGGYVPEGRIAEESEGEV